MNLLHKFYIYFTEDRGILFLLISIFILIFLIYPLAGNSALGSVLTNIFLIFTLFSGVMSVDISPKLRKMLIYLLLVVILLSYIAELFEYDFITHLHIISRILFLWILIILIFIRVFSNNPMTFLYKIAGSITIYLLIGFIWANMYYIFYHFSPGSFHFDIPFTQYDNTMYNFIYFSFVTLTTLGLGDILPLHPFLKSLVTLEAILGPLYLAILIGRLVSSRTTVNK